MAITSIMMIIIIIIAIKRPGDGAPGVEASLMLC